MIILKVLLLTLQVFAQEEAELARYRKQIMEPTTCRPRQIPGKPYKTYQTNCCAPLTLKDGGMARIEDEGGRYKLGVYKNRTDAKPNGISPNAERVVALGSPNQQCLQMKYYADFDIITVYDYRGQTAGFSEWSLEVFKIEDGRASRAKSFVLLDLDEGESSTIMTPELKIEGPDLVLKMTNRRTEPPVVLIEYLNRLEYEFRK